MCKFVEMDVESKGTQPVQSKKKTFSKLEQPNMWGYLRMLIRLFEF